MTYLAPKTPADRTRWARHTRRVHASYIATARLQLNAAAKHHRRTA